MTAVEWLKEKTSDMTIHKTHLNDTISEWQDGYNVALEDVNKLLNKAKEMEKQQIIDFGVWYSGMEQEKVKKAFERFKNETK
jgi:hypothetical protein